MRRACRASPVRWAAGGWIRLRARAWSPCARKLWRERREAGGSAIGQLGDTAVGQLGKSATERLGEADEK